MLYFVSTAVGITNQRETTVVWDKLTGEPLHNAISNLLILTKLVFFQKFSQLGTVHFLRVGGGGGGGLLGFSEQSLKICMNPPQSLNFFHDPPQ